MEAIRVAPIKSADDPVTIVESKPFNSKIVKSKITVEIYTDILITYSNNENNFDSQLNYELLSQAEIKIKTDIIF